jgi:predicted nucleic acid-binding Zn ribbon protein
MAPLHDYTCLSCKKDFEVFYSSQSAVAREEKSEKCPECKSTKKKRNPPKSTSFVLKGKWFKQGY